MLDRLLQLIFGRTQVREKTLPHAIAMLRARVKELDEAAGDIPEAAAVAVIYDAAKRAAEEEADGSVRVNRFLFHVEEAAKKIVEIRSGASDSDPRIRGILEFHTQHKPS